MILALCAALAAPPDLPPVDKRLTDLENRVAVLESRLDNRPLPLPQSQVSVSDTCPCGSNSATCNGQCANCPCPKPLTEVPASSIPPAMIEAAKQDWGKYPTWHYPPGTTMVFDGNGVLVPSQAPTSISYPNSGPPQPLPQATTPVVQPQPMLFAPPPFAFGGPMRFGGACVGRS